MNVAGENMLDLGLKLIQAGAGNGSAMGALLSAAEVAPSRDGFDIALRCLKKAAGLDGPNAALSSWDGTTGRPRQTLENLFRSALLMLRRERAP